MPWRVWLSLVMLALGAGLTVAAQMAGAAPERRGGIFKVGTTGASVQIDPQLAYITTASWLEYATAAKLYNYRPGGKLGREVASRYTVSNNGRRYTFYVRKGFRFSDGAPVTAQSFKYAFDRVLNPDLASPAKQFTQDIDRVVARGVKLVIFERRQDSNLLSTLAMPFFQATSAKLPLDREVVDVRSTDDLPTAGPYAFTRNDANRLTSLRRNPYWKPGPGRTAPRNLDGVDVQWNLDEQTAFEMVKANQLDEGPIPAAEVQNVANQYGVNRSRFWVKALSSCIGQIALNNRRGIFQGNAALRRAVNWAIDRTDYAGVSGPFARTPWTHLLPPSYPGSITRPSLQPYAPKANIAKARAIAAGHFKDGRITVYYRSSGAIGPAEAQLVRRDLINLGFHADNITMKGFSGGDLYDAMGKRGTDADLGVSMGWCSDYPGLAGTFPFLPFGGGSPFFPNSPKYLKKIEAARRLRGNARTTAIGKLDIDIMKNVAPTIVTNTLNNRFFFSNRVDPRSLKYHRVYEDWSIPSLALK
jgi:ABC-type transport system substrate-binding protein